MIFGSTLIRLTAALAFADMCHSEKFAAQPKKERKPLKYPLQVHQMYRDQIQKTVPKTVGEWSAWSSWSACSRSCGGGITQQTRNCINRPADSRFVKKQRRRRQNWRSTNGCVGLYKRIHLCNSQDCPSGQDFRFEQCAAFNNRPFRGTRYQWEPFLKVKDECALNCRAVGMNFFATLNKTTVDGTPCTYPLTHTGKPAPKGTKGVCIDGFCKVVNSRGVIGSLDEPQEECPACLKSNCRSVSGIYTRPDLPAGYSLVAQIPAGACRILVQQLKHTRNFIALKQSNGSFIVNGDWKLSNSRVFQGAGTKFVYIRQDENSLETLTSPGPLSNSVDIMIVNYQTNSGIKYGYSLPVPDPRSPNNSPPLQRPPLEPTASNFNVSSLQLAVPNQRDEPRQPPHPGRRTRLRRKNFHWKITGLTACSKSCGGGIQTYVKTCTRDAGHSQLPVHDRRCAHLQSPAPAPLRCNPEPCPPTWESRWGDCSATCGEGVQRSISECKQDLATGDATVNEALCTRPKPSSTTRPCRLGACESLSNNEVPHQYVEQGRGTEWTVGEWSQCSVSCGTGHRTRSVACPSGQCQPGDRPAHAEYCNLGSCEKPREAALQSSSSTLRSFSLWLTTEWSKCSEACGTGTQIRYTTCAYPEQTRCEQESRPELSRACSSEKACDAQWFIGPWSSCSDSCSGSAKQKREVFCVVKIRGKSHITNDMTCPLHLKPGDEQPCDGTCPPHWYFGDWRQCEGTCPVGVQRRELRCLDIQGREANGCPENDMPVAKRTCACETNSDGKDRYHLAQDEPADRSCVDKIRKCKLAVQARLCHYPYYISHCCESCRRGRDLPE